MSDHNRCDRRAYVATCRDIGHKCREAHDVVASHHNHQLIKQLSNPLFTSIEDSQSHHSKCDHLLDEEHEHLVNEPLGEDADEGDTHPAHEVYKAVQDYRFLVRVTAFVKGTVLTYELKAVKLVKVEPHPVDDKDRVNANEEQETCAKCSLDGFTCCPPSI